MGVVMRKLVGLAAACVAVAGCASEPAPATLKNLYEVEAAARALAPEADVAVLYLMAREKRAPIPGTLRINGDLALEGPLSYGNFYVYCLPPGKYEFVYGPDLAPRDKSETAEVKAGDVHIRDFVQTMPSMMATSITSTNIETIDIEAARALIATKRIATDPAYADAKHRCRKLGR